MPTRGSPIFSVRVLPPKDEKLREKAANHGMTPAEYIRMLIDRDLGYIEVPGGAI